MSLELRRSPSVLTPDSGRVLIRPFLTENVSRVKKIFQRVMELNEDEVRQTLQKVLAEFEGRHLDVKRIFRRHFRRAREVLPANLELTLERELLLGSYFTSEYAMESAALFNPSMVAAPDQDGVPEGWLRFVMSLRATGEGHISSIEFRGGLIDPAGECHFDPVTPFVTEPERIEDAEYDKPLFSRKLEEMGFANRFAAQILKELPEHFTLRQLESALNRGNGELRKSREGRRTRQGMLMLAHSNYQTRFAVGQPLCERIIFPTSPSERNGIEDARFVQFESGGERTYYATYTAYDGMVILPQMIETRDFLHFKVNTLNGPAAENKGMALFPRKIDGLYAMISRQDNENLFIMFSEDVHFWYERQFLAGPQFPWEIVQLGNCGSPIETEKGWLLLMHGVGPMRKYCIGAFLLDLEDPRKVIGRLAEPLMTPNENEREGYVPNVVYTCGALVHRGHLILPYAMSDYASGVATVPLNELLARLT